jgi:phosphatidate cytidylyltransferase
MKRLLTAAVLIPLVLFGVFGGRTWLLAGVIEIFAILAWIEYCSVVRLEPLARAVGLIAGAALILMPFESALFVLAAVALVLPFRSVDLKAGFNSAAAMFLGIFYIYGGMRAGYLLGRRNAWFLFFALALNWVGDTGAYYVGRKFGRHKLAPRISPGKSWEGAIASLLLATAVTALVMPQVVFPISPWFAALFGFAGNIAGQLGDLAESALKRGAGVKDSGTLLPGHGGVLDRIDSTLFTLPVIYLLLAF